jgi:hypothetical protein
MAAGAAFGALFHATFTAISGDASALATHRDRLAELATIPGVRSVRFRMGACPPGAIRNAILADLER